MQSLQSLFLAGKDGFKLRIGTVKGDSLHSYLENLLKHIYNETNELMGEGGAFRKQLSSQEDAILIRALGLVLAQQDFMQISANEIDFVSQKQQQVKNPQTNTNKKSHELPIGLALLGSMASGLLNLNLIWRICLPVAAFIGGELVNVQGGKNKENEPCDSEVYRLTDQGCEKVAQALENLYKNIDYLMDCFKTQEKNLRAEFTSKDKPFEIKYRTLLEKTTNLIGTINYSSEKLNNEITMEAKMLERVLNSMNMELLHYPKVIEGKTEEELYDIIYSYDIKENTLVYPAVVTAGTVVIKGRVDKPAK